MHIIRSEFDPVVVGVAALLAVFACLWIAATTPAGRERTLRLLFLYLTYGVLEIVVKRGAHYVWYLYPIRFGLFFAVLMSWMNQSRRLAPETFMTRVLAMYLLLAALQIFNPHQENLLVGLLGWLSDYLFAVLYFVAADLFDGVEPMRRFLRLTAILGALSAAVCFVEQWLGPNELMRTYPTYVRLLYYGPVRIEYRPASLSPFNEIFAVAAMVALVTSQRRSWKAVAVIGAGIAACVVANALHGVRIAWVTGFIFLALYVLFIQRRRWLAGVIVAGSIALAMNIGMSLTSGLISSQMGSLGRPVQTFQRTRLSGLMAFPRIVPEYPFGVGVGESSAGLRLIDSTGVTTFGTHNYLTELAAQMSIVGPLLLLLFCGGILVTALRVVWPAKPDEWRALMSMSFALFGAVTVTFFGGGALGGYPMNEYFWLLAGAMMGLLQARRSRATAAEVTRPVRLRNLLSRPLTLPRAGLSSTR
jgi:hypothetical protein